MYYTVYKTKNLENGTEYIGYHATKKLDDGYLGSGTILQKSLKKYGTKSFKKEILFIYSSSDAALKKEAELVNEEYIKRNDTYNIVLGGGKGYSEMVSCINIETDKVCQIHQKDFDENPKYIGITKNKVSVKFRHDRSIPSKYIHVNDYDKKIHISNWELSCEGKTHVYDNIDKTTKLVFDEEYKNNKDRYMHNSTNKFVVYNSKLDKNEKIDRDKFDKNIHSFIGMNNKGFGSFKAPNGSIHSIKIEDGIPAGYVGLTHGLTSCRNVDTGEILTVTKDEFKRRKDLVGLSTDTVAVKHIKTGKRTFISVKQFELSDEYVGITSGAILINNTKKNKFVYDKEINEYLDNGWTKGSYIKSKVSNTIWINNTHITKRVTVDKLSSFLDNGWTKGRLQK